MLERLIFLHFPTAPHASHASLPTHITLVGWFMLESSRVPALIEEVCILAKSLSPIHTVAGEDALFGDYEDIPVCMLRHGPLLPDLHAKLLSAVLELGGGIDGMRWSGPNYRPHITRKPDMAFSYGDEFIIRSMSLVRAVSENPKQREIVEHFHW